MRATTAIYFTITAIVVLLLVYGRQTLSTRPVRFKTLDEVSCVAGVAAWATHQLGFDPFDRRLLLSNQLWRRWYPTWLPQLERIPKEELAVLAPFIDKSIAGQGPALNLPPEYEDYRPRVLAAFKSRMEAEGLWPS